VQEKKLVQIYYIPTTTKVSIEGHECLKNRIDLPCSTSYNFLNIKTIQPSGQGEAPENKVPFPIGGKARELPGNPGA